jgi:HPt (histidine-containing phosphotransfer) domain-containing protein
VQGADELVDWNRFVRVRAELGSGFVRILGYFREDGIKAVAAVEQAIRDRSSAALVLPAHTLKGEARQFGAEPLASLAEEIEMTARRLVETHQTPEELIERIVGLRPMFEATFRLFDQEMATPPAAPAVVERRSPAGFGRKAPRSFGVAQR